MTTDNRIILFTAPDKEGVHVPSKSEILAVIKDFETQAIEAYEEADLSSPLIENATPGLSYQKNTTTPWT